MFLSRLRFFRIPMSFVFFGLLVLSIIFIKNEITSAWQSDQQEEAIYLKSPNCFTHKDASEVDPNLPPCQNFMATVIAKPQNTVIKHRRACDYPRTHLLLTLQYANGDTQTVGDITADMWNSISVGSQVSIVLWRNEVKEVDANGYHQSLFDEKKWNRTTAGLVPWIIIGLISSACLSLLWKLPSGSARIPC